MRYKYETHLHTREGSACAPASAEEMTRAYKEAGYDGIFVTNHFFNGNTSVPSNLAWPQRVDCFFDGYKKACLVGMEIGLKVFFGLEYTVFGTDFLIYGIDREWLLAHENIHEQPPRQVFSQIHKDGGFIVHAHPFLEADYIDHIRLYPYDVDAVEVINGRYLRGSSFNDRARAYADMYGLKRTGGSDSHCVEQVGTSGIETTKPIETPMDYFRLLQAGDVVPIQVG